MELDIDRLTPNTYQPRVQFDDARLDELARSIKSNGVIQPIVVRKVGEQYHIIAGERRWRAAQKAGLVMELIRGKEVNRAIATLKFTRKGVAEDILKVLNSAVANATQKDGFGGDVDRLYVSACFANQGPSQKRVRPAPMGRAFRVLKRTAHLTVQVSERPLKIARVAAEGEGASGRKKAASKGAKA